MKCIICKRGDTQDGVMTATFEKAGTTLVIKKVPAQVCDNCGENYLSQEISNKLLRLAEEAANAGVQVDIRNYVAA